MIETAVKTQAAAEAILPSASAPSFSGRVQGERRPLSPTGTFILVIDGSPTLQKIIEVTLRGVGYEVRSFRDGIAAMRWFAGPEARTPDLMLVDLDLPKLDGYHVLQKFKAKPRFAHTACVLLCEQENPAGQNRKTPAWAGAVASLPKPFTIQQLVTTVQSSLADILAHVD